MNKGEFFPLLIVIVLVITFAVLMPLALYSKKVNRCDELWNIYQTTQDSADLRAYIGKCG